MNMSSSVNLFNHQQHAVNNNNINCDDEFSSGSNGDQIAGNSGQGGGDGFGRGVAKSCLSPARDNTPTPLNNILNSPRKKNAYRNHLSIMGGDPNNRGRDSIGTENELWIPSHSGGILGVKRKSCTPQSSSDHLATAHRTGLASANASKITPKFCKLSAAGPMGQATSDAAGGMCLVSCPSIPRSQASSQSVEPSRQPSSSSTQCPTNYTEQLQSLAASMKRTEESRRHIVKMKREHLTPAQRAALSTATAQLSKQNQQVMSSSSSSSSSSQSPQGSGGFMAQLNGVRRTMGGYLGSVNNQTL